MQNPSPVNHRFLVRLLVSLLRVLARPQLAAVCVVAAAAALWTPDAQAQTIFRETFGTVDAQLPTATSTADGNWTSAFCLNGQIVAGGSPSDDTGSTHFLLDFTQGPDTNFPSCTYAPGEAVWRTVTPIPVLPNTTYVFSYWSSQRTAPSPAVLTQVVTPNAGAITVDGTTNPAWSALNTWVQRTVRFTTGATTTAVDLRINNANTVGSGNDFGIDDVMLAAQAPPLACGTGVAQTISGSAQAWTTDSIWQVPAGTAAAALNAPNAQGVQLFSGLNNRLELDIATVVPAGETVAVYLAKHANAVYTGPVLIESSLDGNTWAAGVTHTPTTTAPAYAPLDYVVPAGGARYVRVVPQTNGGAGTVVLVDAVTYSFQYCECAGGTNLVQQPSFEEFASCSVQAGPFGAWSPIQNNIHIWGPSCGQGWPVPDGVDSVDLDGGTTGGIQQTLTGLNPGQRYNLTFYMSFNPAAGALAASMRVQIGDFNQIYTSASNAQVGGFNRVFVEFTAQSATEVLQFHSLTGNGSPTLLAGGGQPGYGVVVDDIRITTKYCDDFSDAPASFGTAAHTGTGPQLGIERDNEVVAAPSADASGDDAAGIDDEDALQSVTVRETATAAQAVVTALNPTATPATLAGWIDFNGNGTFEAGERAQVAVPANTVAATPFTLTWSGLAPVPLASGATTFARFRIATSAAELASPTGTATSGEVEDHSLVVLATANLAVVKSASPNPYVPGAPLTYSIVVTNAGPSAAVGARVQDTLPAPLAGFTWTCAPSGAATCGTASGSGNIDALVNVPAGDSVTFTVGGVVSPTLLGPLTNTATVTPPAGVTDPDPGDNESSTTTPGEPRADLAISKAGAPSPYVPGEPFTYTIVVSNLGPSAVPGAVVDDPLPAPVAGFTWECLPNGGASCGSANGTGSIAGVLVDLPPGGSALFTVTGTIASGTTTPLVNTATVTPPPSVLDPVPGNNSATNNNDANILADLRVTKASTPNPFVPGQPLTYTIVVTNAGPSDALGARVQDALPSAFAGFGWVCAADAGGACGTPSGTGNIDALVDLPAGSTATFTSTGTVPSSYTGTATNTATITPPPDVTDPVPGNNSSTSSNPPDIIADLSIVKTLSPDPYVPGAAVTYTIVVSNTGPSDATHARVQDAMPAALTGVSWTCAAPPGAVCGIPAGVGDIDALVSVPAGGTVTFTVTATAPASLTGVLNNTATVTPPSTVTDPNPGNNTSTVTSGPAPEADLSTTKTSSPDPYVPGSPLTYSIVVRNDGPSDVTAARMQDAFPAPMSGFTWTCAPSGGGVCGTATGMSTIDVLVDLAAGASVTFTVTGVVPASATGPQTNTATVTPPIGTKDPDPSDNSSTSTTSGAPQADLSVTKTSTPNPYVPGSPINYTIVIANAGPSASLDTRVRDIVPAVLQNVAWGCSAAGGTCSVPSGTGNIDILVDIAPGGTITFELTGDVPMDTTGSVVNTATVLPPTGTTDPSPNNNSAVNANPVIVSGGPADLQITQEFPGVAPPNGLLTFRLVSKNLGSNTALNPYMTGLIPPGTTFVSVTPSDGGTCNVPGNPPAPDPATGYPMPGAATEPLRCTWPGLMKPGESHSMEFTVRVAPGTPTGQILWSCWWTWSQTDDPYHANNVVDAYLFVDDGLTPVGDLAIQAGALSEGVVATSLPTRVGTPVPMRFWVTNHGPAATRGQYALILDTASTIEVLEFTLPQGWVSPSGPASAVWDTGPVAPGQTVALDLTVRMRATTSVELFAQRIAGSPGDPNAANERATIVLDGYGPGAAGRWVAVGNVDGSGAGEIVTGAGQGETPQVRVFTGAGADTGLRFFAYERPFLGGVHIASCDVDGDGIGELITAPGPGRASSIRVLSLLGGVVTELVAFDAFEPGFLGGASIACADLDADGSAELIIGAGPGRAPEVQVYNVGLGSVTPRASFLAYEAGFMGGVRVAAGAYPGRAGWLDAFAIVTTPGAGRAPELRLWTETGAPVAQVVVSTATNGVLPTLGDMNGDGQLDLLLTPDDGRPELVKIFNVDTGELLGHVQGGMPSFPVGIRTAIGVLEGGPGQAEIVIGNGPGGHPRVRVIYWPPSGPVQRLEILPLEIP